MYDNKTESLWSQVQGKAVVGDFTDTELKLLNFSILSFEEFLEKFPEGLVLSDKTGFIRDYSFDPYGNYEEVPSLFFPTDDFDNRLPVKELVFVVPLEEQKVAFVLNKLNEKKSASIIVNGKELKVTLEDPYKAVYNGEEKAGYVAMYFSVAIHNPDLIIWNGEE